MNIQVSIIEDQNEIREMLEILVKGSAGLSLLSSYANAESALQELPSEKPDVLLVDINLPGMSGIEVVSKLSSLMTQTQFIICTAIEDNEVIFKALKAGANGYIVKSDTSVKLIESIKEVHMGGSPMSSQIARKVISSFKDDTAESEALKMLSEREQQILELLSKGYRYKEIAANLFLSIETIRTHIRNIYSKLQVNSRTEALNKVFPKK